MSYTELKNEVHIARKKYRCDAYSVICGAGIDEFDIEDQKKIKNFSGKIQPVEKYHYFVMVFDGDFGIFRANPEMFQIYNKYKLYEE